MHGQVAPGYVRRNEDVEVGCHGLSVLTVWVHTFPTTDEQFVQPVNLEPMAAIYAIVFKLFIALNFENEIVGSRCLINDPVV